MRSLKKSIYVIGLLLQVLCFQTACTNLSESPREVTNINNCWKYAQGDYTGAEQVGYDDGNWENIGIPHSFSIPYFMAKDFYVGYGWYRKHLQLNEEFPIPSAFPTLWRKISMWATAGTGNICN